MTIKNAITYSGGGGDSISTGLMAYGRGLLSMGAVLPERNYLDTDNDWDMVSSGFSFGLGIKGGKLYSWGWGNSYRTGQGSTSDIFDPIQVGSYDDWWMVSAGFNHGLGIRKTWDTDHYDYTLWVWGENASYQLGNGSTTDVQTPTQIGTDTDWEWVSAGLSHSAAIKNGSLYTCGSNSSYRTGQNTSSGSTTTWTSYDSSTGWTKVFTGAAHTIGIKDGSLYGFGDANLYSFGNSSTADLQVPTQVNASTDWVTGSCGNLSSYFINSSGELYVAGYNIYGQLGTGDTTTVQSWTQIGTDTDWEDVAHSNSTQVYTSICIKGGKLYASGDNNSGQCGQPPSVASSYSTHQQVGEGTNYIDATISDDDPDCAAILAIRQT